jgi:hypothetical protein
MLLLRQPPDLPPWSSHDDVSTEIALVIHRPAGADRRVLNDVDLTAALHTQLHAQPPAHAALRGGARLVDLGTLSTRAQLALVRRSGVLVGAHGAGLLWNLFLRDGAPLVELLNVANANAYYANHCEWTRRPYAAWQNNDSAAEEPALDANGTPFAPFRNHVRVDVEAVVAIVRSVLKA